MSTDQNDILMARLQTIVGGIDDRIDALSSAIRSSTPCYYRFYGLPVISKLDEAKRLAGFQPEELLVTNFEPNTLLDEFSASFGNHYAFDDISTVYMQRHPGVIAYPDSPPAIIELINDINQLKLDFSDTLASYRAFLAASGMATTSMDELTHRFIHTACPRLLTEFIKRKIQHFSTPATNVYFSLRKDAKDKRLSKPQLIVMLNKQLAIAKEFENTDLAIQISLDISTVQKCSHEKFIQKCDDYICPTATISLGEAKKNIRALLPFFLFNTDPRSLVVGSMKSYSKSGRASRQQRRDKKHDTPVLERIGIYAA